MRLITLSLFACLLAVSAFGQSPETRGSTVLIHTSNVLDTDDASAERRRFCSGVLLGVRRRWVLTAASCLGWQGNETTVYSPIADRNEQQGGPYAEQALQVVIHPLRPVDPLPALPGEDRWEIVSGDGRSVRDASAYDLALIQLACSMSGRPARRAVMSDQYQFDTQEYNAVAVPYQGAAHSRYNAEPIMGPASRRDDVLHQWILQGGWGAVRGEARGALPGMPLYAPFNGEDILVGILSGVAGVQNFGLPNPSDFPNNLVPNNRYPVFTDILGWETREWITRTMRESLYLYELCGYGRR